MNKQQFDEKLQSISDEMQRLTMIIGEPTKILTEFYDPFRPNLLQRLFTVMGYDSEDVYDVLVEQLSHLPLLTGCRIFKTPGRTEGPLHIHYCNPEFALIIVDIKGKRFESIYESVLRGMDANIEDAKERRDVAQKAVTEMKEIDRTIRQLTGGDITLRGVKAFLNRENIKKYLRGLNYNREDASAIVRDMESFLNNVQTQIDKRQAVLAEMQRHAEACYLSDLRTEHCLQRMPLIISRMNPNDYSLEAWNLAATYLLKQNIECQDILSVCKRLLSQN